MKSDDSILSVIVPFKDINILSNNLLKSFELTEKRIEVIFSHDSAKSLDSAQIDSLTKRNSKFKYLHGDFGSPGLARNMGIEKASGDWIAFWDSDDFGFIDIICNGVYESTEQIMIGNFCICKEGKVHTPKRTFTSFESQIAINPGMWRFAFRSELARRVKFTDLKLGEDIIYLIDIGALDLPRTTLDDVVYEYRISTIQSTQNMNLELNLVKFLDVLVDRMIRLHSKNKISFGILWRQIFSLLKISNGRRFLYCLRLVFVLASSLNALEKVKFAKSIMIIFKRGSI